MGQVIFGQPDNGIIQHAYVVEDIRKAIDEWVNVLKGGPWFLIERFGGGGARYRGGPSRAESALAMSFAGHMNIELIQPVNDAPSVYWDTIRKRGYGFHHWGVATPSFEGDLDKYKLRGYELAFLARVPTGGRVAYMDASNELAGMVELIELGAGFDTAFGRFYAATIGWDGKDPIRPFV